MRVLILLLSFGLAACAAPAEDPAKVDEFAALKKRITKLENRVRQLENRSRKNPRGKPARKPVPRAPAGPMRMVQLEGDAKVVMLAGGQRRFKLPGQVPHGDFVLLAAFADETLERKGELKIGAGQGPVILECLSSVKTCKAK